MTPDMASQIAQCKGLLASGEKRDDLIGRGYARAAVDAAIIARAAGE